MAEKIYFYLLILCGIWSQEIIRTFADEIKEPSDFLVRQKRVVSYLPREDKATAITDVPYVVIIRCNNRITCVGTILSHHVVITYAPCVRFSASEYQILSGTARSDRGTNHNVTNIERRTGSHPSRPADGIALLTVDPPFVYGAYAFNIQLHSGPLLEDTHGLISGWGYNCRSADRGTRIPGKLRTIEVRVMAHQDCVNIYRPQLEISDKEVCTHHPQRHCGHTDGGAPLIIEGHLAGINLWTQPNRDQYNPHYPDIFVVLQHSEYNQWIRRNVRDIEAQFENRHK